ncbi:Fe-S cluster assembly ATPase SufC [Alkaliphilus sp. MSJ-5]|uniref:Fe-S cluster assembly ATPase SufC n=1 Tax=Alkaliphilus flagellatus TaxID=2841507 RepID=A0ABS6G3X4_9FIRM|nr:Fe-S cluster assembly ATPase SufC [Alkaliphilus flagellatus]MBU5676066.1 Fe-S cluster assembly ATPase SufC [Alkaliphilus flagellatus]
MSKSLLKINNLHVSIGEKKILKGLNLEIKPGEIHAIMGPNGGGKSTLSNTIMGSPKGVVEEGSILLEGEEINNLTTDERAKKGIFLSFQYPEEIPGVTVQNFLRTAYNAVKNENISILKFEKLLKEKMALLDMKEEYANRYLNEGFSGGEKKKNEILQMSILEPKLAILDETDSGLDIDALRIVSEGVNKAKAKDTAVLIITHYNRILDYIKPDVVHVLMDGKIVKSGDSNLAKMLEDTGYEDIK